LLLLSPKQDTDDALEKQRYTRLDQEEACGKHANVAFATRSPFTPSRKFAIKTQVIASPTNLSDRAYRELIIFEQLSKLKDSVHFPNQTNFVTVVEWFKTKSSEGEPYMHYVMDCAEMTLNDLKRTSIHQYKCILFQILFGLYVAQNECEFVHNDLHMKNVLLFKPKNDSDISPFKDGDDVWYTSGFVVKITDFGLSRIRLGSSVIFNQRNPMTELFDPTTDVDNIVTEMSKIKILPDSWVVEDVSPDSKKTLTQAKRKELENLKRLAKSGARLEKILRHKFFDSLKERPEEYVTPEKPKFGTPKKEKAEKTENTEDKENLLNHSNVTAKTVSTPFKFRI